MQASKAYAKYERETQRVSNPAALADRYADIMADQNIDGSFKIAQSIDLLGDEVRYTHSIYTTVGQISRDLTSLALDARQEGVRSSRNQTIRFYELHLSNPGGVGHGLGICSISGPVGSNNCCHEIYFFDPNFGAIQFTKHRRSQTLWARTFYSGYYSPERGFNEYL